MLGFLAGMIFAILALPAAQALRTCLGPAHVTVLNATGGNVSNVVVTLGTVARRLPDLLAGRALTMAIPGPFGECSTHVAWMDARGSHAASAEDYMESAGVYHARVVLTPEGRATAIEGIAWP